MPELPEVEVTRRRIEDKLVGRRIAHIETTKASYFFLTKPEVLRERDHRKALPPLYGALLKNEQDVHLVEQLIFLNRRDAR